MKLKELTAGCGVEPASAMAADPEIAAVTDDSRRVLPNSLFVAVNGKREDGAQYAADAVKAGAVAVIAAHAIELPAGIPLLLAKRPRRALGLIAARLFGQPSESLRLVAVTGTNGKTTTSYLVEAMAEAAGFSPGVVGTIAYRYARQVIPAPQTTPGPVELQGLLRQMVDAGTDLVAMEISSHALDQERVAGLTFSACAFTNLTRDHLDYHRDMDEYFDAKSKLFTQYLSPDGVAVVNGDDEWGQRLAAELKGMRRTAWRFSLKHPQSEIVGSEVKISLEGIELAVKTPVGPLKLKSPLTGGHNVENLLAAAGLAVAVGMPRRAIETGAAHLARVPGRLERISGKGIHVFVDYAHTDDALRRVMSTLRQLGRGRLIVMFGCGGDRDPGKRALMGEAAGKAADQLIVTSDNPRSEPPAAIAAMITPGVEKAGMRRTGLKELANGERGYAVEPDRRLAIEVAIGLAHEGDVVLLAGKGHEDYQLVGGEKRHFDDVEEARRVLGV